MGVGLIVCGVGCNDGRCKFCSQNLYRGECLGCLNGSYGPELVAELREVIPQLQEISEGKVSS